MAERIVGSSRVIDLLTEVPHFGRRPEPVGRLGHHLGRNDEIVAEHVERPLNGAAERAVGERLEPRLFPSPPFRRISRASDSLTAICSRVRAGAGGAAVCARPGAGTRHATIAVAAIAMRCIELL